MATRIAAHAGPEVRGQRDRARCRQETIRSTAEIGRVVTAVTGAMAAAGYPGRDVFGVQLALEEALVNGVKHGNGCDPARSVRVRYRVTGRRVLAEVQDEGPGFDPGEVPDPTEPENMERPCGRGLLLMRCYMTRVRYNERGNRVTLCKERSAS